MNSLVDNVRDSLAGKISAKFLVAVSGGPDSVALLHAMYKLNCNCAVAHCNFHLRGKDSDDDAGLVKKLSVVYGFVFHIAEFDTVTYAKEERLSVEMAARNLRYNWFDELIDEYKYDYVVIAHNANDTIETFFMNLVRGTGIKGLCGIPKKRGNIIRPMMNVSRPEVMEYIQQNGLEYHIDKTNSDVAYTRNFIRHNILPQFLNLNPSFVNTMLSNISRLSDISDVVDEYSSQLYDIAVEEKNNLLKINLSLLAKSKVRSEVLFKWLYPFGFSSDDIKLISRFENLQSGKHFFSDSSVALLDRNSLIIADRKEFEPDDSVFNVSFDIDYPITITHQIIDKKDFVLEKNPNVACLDADKCSGLLTLRHWRKGDSFVPFGMRGSRKLSDFFNDCKLSVIEKNRVWLLCMDDEIVWVVGMRISNKYAVTGNTNKILKLLLK